MTTPPPNPDHLETEQGIINLSWDKEFGVVVAEMIGFDGSNLVRVAVDGSGILQIS